MKTKEELKTLKDLPRLVICSRKDDFVSDIVSEADAICSSILKTEAVKWVKRMNNYEALAWKKFFNLTEDDLK